MDNVPFGGVENLVARRVQIGLQFGAGNEDANLEAGCPPMRLLGALKFRNAKRAHQCRLCNHD